MSSERGVQVLGAVLATVWLVVFVALDVATAGATFVLASLFALSPLIACTVLPARVTSVFAVAAVTLTIASGWWDRTWGTEQQLVRIADVVLVSGAAVAVAVVRVSREHRFERVVAIAEVAQRAVLPTLPQRVRHVGVGARYVSAAQDAVVGGDLYDCYHSDGYLRFLVGDVRGKGIGAVEQAARVIRAFRQAAATQPTLSGVASDMSAYLAPFFDDEEFVTACLVEANEPGVLSLVSCGHPPPMLVDQDDRATFLEAPPGLPLGLGEDYDAVSVAWMPGQRLLLYTDGLSEARDAQGEFMPLPRLAPFLAADAVDPALDAVLGQVRGHVTSGELTDDMALMLLEHRTPEPGHVGGGPEPMRTSPTPTAK